MKKIKIAFKIFATYLKKILLIDKFKKSRTERRQLLFHANLIGQGRLIFDVGANIGDKTAMFLKLGSRVVCVEPQSEMVAVLRGRFSGNPSVTVEHCGASDQNGTAVINKSSKYPGFSSFISSWQSGTKYNSFDKTETVETKTLDSLIAKYGRPDFCKIDVEGFEPKVLAGLTSKIPLLNFEFHSDDMETLKRCLNRLEALGYKEFSIVPSEYPEAGSAEWDPARDIVDKIGRSEAEANNMAWGDIYAR